MLDLRCISIQQKANMLGLLAVGLSAIAQLVLSPVVKAGIGVDGLGMWHLLFQTFCYLQIADLGLSSGIVREVAAARAKGDPRVFANALATSKRGLTFVGIAFAVFGGLACLLLPCFIEIPAIFKKDFLIALGLLSCWGLLRYPYSLFLLNLLATNRIVTFNALDLIQLPGRPLLGAVFLIFNLGLSGIAAGYILIEAFVRVIASRMHPLSRISGRYDHKQFMRMFTFGSSTSVVSISTLVIFYSSSFIVGWRLGVTEVAVYQSTMALLLLIARFAIIPFSNLLPGFIQHYEAGDTSTLRKRGRYTHALVMALVSGLLILACILNKAFVTLWVGEELFAGYHFTIGYGLFLFCSIARHNGYMMYQAVGYLKPIVVCHLIEIPVNLALSIILMDKFGLAGIAYAYILASLPVTIASQLPFFSGHRMPGRIG